MYSNANTQQSVEYLSLHFGRGSGLVMHLSGGDRNRGLGEIIKELM